MDRDCPGIFMLSLCGCIYVHGMVEVGRDYESWSWLDGNDFYIRNCIWIYTVLAFHRRHFLSRPVLVEAP